MTAFDRIKVRALAGMMSALAASPCLGGALEVVSVSPPVSSANVAPGSPISVTFNQPVMASSVNADSFWAFARWSGSAEGAITLSNGDQTVTLTPKEQFSAGESVMVILSHDIQAADGSPFRTAGWSWQFTIRAGLGNLTYNQYATLHARTVPTESVRSYGGIASDLDNDGWLDVTLVNEDSADLRVFMNTATGQGTYDPFLQPTFPVGDRASPSEPSDFNRDGFTDICVCNINVNSVSVLLGIGDGTYGPQQVIAVGSAPRGIAVLDIDGDGDIDIANTNAGSGNACTLLNNGSGVFGLPTFYEGGTSGEWAMAAAEMNNDGILDLVIGGQTGQQVVVNLGTGNGTFTPQTAQSAGGQTWMLNAADVNGDGNNDVVTANGLTNNAARLLGNGAGGLGPAQVITVEPWAIGSDLGDLDGDGDLDWIVSSYNGDWRMYTNNGAGAFTFNQEINSPQAASCALMFDADRDGDLDLGLIDELADVVLMLRNGGIEPTGDVNDDGDADVDDLLGVINAWGPCPAGAPCHNDVTGDGAVNVDDLLMVINNWGA